MKNWISFLIVLLFMATTIGTVSAAPLFKDVNDTYWGKAELDFLVEKGILTSNSEVYFGVNKEITRLEASEILIKALKLNMNNRPTPSFKDINLGHSGYKVIATIVDEGIMKGTADGEFKPYDKLTRSQMAVILVRAFNLKGTSTFDFRDVSKNHWASSSIKTLLANKITTGYPDNTYKSTAAISRSQFAIFLARILNPDFKQTPACYQPKNTATNTVNVAVTTLWKEPNSARAIDRPSTSNPVDLMKWTKSMTINQKQWLVGKIESQALLGQEVVILNTRGNWHQIAIIDQYSPKNKAGYPGWVPKSHITTTYPNYQDCSIAIIDVPTAILFNDTKPTSEYMKISFNTSLPVLKKEAGWVHVQTPDNGVKFLRAQDAKIYKNKAAIPKPLQKDLVDTAKKFTGLPYLWAGTSGFGLDCSGFTYSVYKQHGISIPRDSAIQAIKGTAVSKEDLQPGDLLFFAHNKGKGNVHHVSMYIGNGLMIHSPNPKKSVEIVSITLDVYKTEFSGARRYLK